jgi:hypothetical protein
MSSEHDEIPIWFFIGSLVLVYGVIIFAVGLYHFARPPQGVLLANLHADFWWGLLMIAVGLIYGIKYCPFRGRTKR